MWVAKVEIQILHQSLSVFFIIDFFNFIYIYIYVKYVFKTLSGAVGWNLQEVKRFVLL